jgi:hypothetical protein
LDKARGVLSETELLKQVRNLLHRGRASRILSGTVRPRTDKAKQSAKLQFAMIHY